MGHGLFSLQIAFSPLLWTASAKLLKKSQFPSFQWVSLPFSCSYSALGRSIWDNCWKSCNFDAFPTAEKHHFYDFIALHCQGFLRSLSMSLHTNRWHMAYFLCNVQGFPSLWAASAKLLKKLQFPSFQWVSLPFSNLSFALGRSIRDNFWKSCNFHAFPTAAKHHFYDPSFFRPLPRFPAEFEHVTTYKQMACGLFSLQFSMFSFALGGFCHFHPFNGFLCNFLGFPLLWAVSAKNAEKVILSRFPSVSEHVTNKSKWHMAYFLCNKCPRLSVCNMNLLSAWK